MGREGLKEAALQSTQKAHYLAGELAKIPGISLAYPQAAFFKEFVINTPISADQIIEKMLPRAIYAGVKVGEKQLMLAVTEKKRKAEIDEFVKAMQEVCHV
jgi:glycine dehydrogenase subunit 1